MRTIYIKWLILFFVGVLSGFSSGFSFLFAQQIQEEFSTQFFFEGANGKKDTLVLGYDKKATYGTNICFGEVEEYEPNRRDISHIGVYYSILQTFIYHYWFYGSGYFEPLWQGMRLNDHYKVMYFKKQIVANTNHIHALVLPIIIPEEALPVTIKWNADYFQDSSRSGSFLSNLNPGQWSGSIPHFVTDLKDYSQKNITLPVYSDHDYYVHYYDSANKKECKYLVVYLSFQNSQVRSVFAKKNR